MRLRIWTADEPARKLPAGRAKRVNPLSPPYLEKSPHENAGFFASALRGDEKPRPGFDKIITLIFQYNYYLLSNQKNISTMIPYHIHSVMTNYQLS